MKYSCIKQHDITDCGAACLATICRQYGSKVSISKIRDIAGTDTMGTSAYGLTKAARELGLTPRVVKATEETFFIKFPLPCITNIVINGTLQHYVVIHKITKKYILIADPAKGIVKKAPSDFFSQWTHTLILVVPSDDFQKNRNTQNLSTRFWKLILPQKVLVAKICLISLFVTILGILGAFYFQLIIDNIIPSGRKDILTTVSIGIIALKVCCVFLLVLRAYLLLYFSQALDTVLLLGCYEHVLKLPMNFFSTRKVGEITSRFQDTSTIRDAISNATLTVMMDTLMAFASGFILFRKNRILFFVAFMMVILYFILVFTFQKAYKDANQAQMEDRSQLNAYLTESIHGIETIKSFNGEQKVRMEATSKFEKMLRSIVKLSRIENMQEGLKFLVELVGEVVILWVGASRVLCGDMTVGSLVSFNALLAYFLTPVKNIIDLQSTLQTAIVASDRLSEILDLDVEKNNDHSERITPVSLKGDIYIRDISFRYGTRFLTLEHFSMDIYQGERIAIVGESGAGKTTVAKLLLSLYRYESGSITINDYALPNIQLEALREKIAYVPQETFLFSGTILENLTFGSYSPSMEDVIRCAKMAQVHEFVNSLPLQYETHLDENGSNLSGGQRQRIALARAMLKNPDILILDEATSNLDAATEKAIQETIESYSKDMTTIIIAHRLSTIRRCDKIFVMERGRIIESGTHADLIAKPDGYYRCLYQAQVGTVNDF